MELRQLLTLSGRTPLEVPLMIYPNFFCLLVCSSFVFSVIYYGALCLYVYMLQPVYPVFLYFGQSGVIFNSFAVCLFYNLSKCILL